VYTNLEVATSVDFDHHNTITIKYCLHHNVKEANNNGLYFLSFQVFPFELLYFAFWLYKSKSKVRQGLEEKKERNREK
jgi:hypothetical protein